jgi:hypothetical protein
MKGIRKNVITKKLKLKTGKAFSEDLVEDMLRSYQQAENNYSPK